MHKDRSPRRRPENRARKQAGSVRRGLNLLILALPIVTAAALAYYVVHSPWLTVQDVKVSGSDNLDEAQLIEISGIKGASMFDLETDKVLARLADIPQVASVSFERRWPNGVTLKVTERTAIALWSVGGADYAIDSDGVVLGAGAPNFPAPHIFETDSNRVMSTGDRVQPDAIKLAQRIFDESPKFLGETIDRLEYSPAIGVTAVFRSGLRVTFGDERAYDYKIAVLSKLLDQHKNARAVDLRFGTRVTYE